MEAARRVLKRNETRARQLVYWHRDGYVKRRKRHLAGQRARILEQLDQLAQEAKAC